MRTKRTLWNIHGLTAKKHKFWFPGSLTGWKMKGMKGTKGVLRSERAKPRATWECKSEFVLCVEVVSYMYACMCVWVREFHCCTCQMCCMPSLVGQARGCQEGFKNKHLWSACKRKRHQHAPGAPVPPAWDQVDSYEHVSAHLQAFCQLNHSAPEKLHFTSSHFFLKGRNRIVG